MERGKTTIRPWLIALIVAGSLLRLFICFNHNPLDYVFSDASRHWTNGKLFLHPNLMGKCDPILYQAFVFIIQKITGEQRLLIALVYGLLSVITPWTFYRAARELGLGKIRSLVIWVLIVWTPSLFVIFHYIMIEALLLPLEGLSLWMTGRYLRKGDSTSFLVCITCWTLACLTKPTAIALAITCSIYAWWIKSRKPSLLLLSCALVFLLLFPQCLRSYQYLGFIAPTGSHWTPKILHKSDAKRIRIQTSTGGRWGFSSPTCYTQPLEPLSSWMTHRSYEDSTVSIQVNLKNGEKDWKEAYARLNRNWDVWLRQLAENIVVFLFAPSWPDSNLQCWDGWVNYESRWLWAPLIFLLFKLNYHEFRQRRFDLIPVAVTVLTLVLALQNMIDMEGRYRKPLEPLLFLNIVWALRRSERNVEDQENIRFKVQVKKED